MKIKFLLLILACTISTAWGQIRYLDVHVKTYGQLEQTLGEQWDKIDSLIVHGPVNSKDLHTMWKCSFKGQLKILNLEDAIIEHNIIPDKAFWDQDAQENRQRLPLQKIMFPETIQEIGDFAFMFTDLKTIQLPKNLKKIGIGCFSYCQNLQSATIVIPEGVTEIPGICFQYAGTIKKMILPSTLKYIGDVAFYETKISSIDFAEGLDSIGFASFYASDLENVILPNSLQKIGKTCFASSFLLKEIRMPENLTSIPDHFAQQCFKLEKVILPTSLLEIGDGAFSSDSKLENIQLPEGLTEIKANAFENCPLNVVIFPKSLKVIGENCFNHIEKIYSIATTPAVCKKNRYNQYTFQNLPQNTPLFVPLKAANNYKRSAGWNYLTNIIETNYFPTNIETIVNNEKCPFRLSIHHKVLNIENTTSPAIPIEYNIFNIEGKLIRHGEITTSTMIPLQEKGYYIVRIGQYTEKIGL